VADRPEGCREYFRHSLKKTLILRGKKALDIASISFYSVAALAPSILETENTCMMPKQMVGLIEDDLQRVEEAIARHLESEVSFSSEVARYVLSSGGKRIRPVLLILCARLCNYIE
jgi:hypothetical protein